VPFEKQVGDKEILDAFDRDDVPRQVYGLQEIADGVDGITKESVRKRLRKMEGEEIEAVKIGSIRLYHRAGADPFTTDISATTPLGASAAATQNGWREILTRGLAWTFGTSRNREAMWYAYEDSPLSYSPLLIRFFTEFVLAFALAAGAALLLFPSSTNTPVTYGALAGVATVVLDGVRVLAGVRHTIQGETDA